MINDLRADTVEYENMPHGFADTGIGEESDADARERAGKPANMPVRTQQREQTPTPDEQPLRDALAQRLSAAPTDRLLARLAKIGINACRPPEEQ